MDLEADADICAEARVANLESLEEVRELAQVCSLWYHQKLANAYEKTLQTRIFAKGQMILRAKTMWEEVFLYPQSLYQIGRGHT